MKTSVTARHFDLTPQVHDHAINAMEGLGKYFERIVDAQLILIKEKSSWRAETIIGVPGETLTAESSDDQLFTAIDDATAKAERQLKKYKAKFDPQKDRRSIHQLNTEPPESRKR